MRLKNYATILLLIITTVIQIEAAGNIFTLRGEVIDADTKATIPCRIYIQDEKGKWQNANADDDRTDEENNQRTLFEF